MEDAEEILRQGAEEEKAKATITQRVSDFQNAFMSNHGTGALDYLSKFCMEHDCTFVTDSDRKSAFNEGARSVILEIRHWLDFDLSKLEKE